MGIRAIVGAVFSKMVEMVNGPNGDVVRANHNGAGNENSFASGFFLDRSSTFEVSRVPYSIPFPRWMTPRHFIDLRPSLIVVAGESVTLSDVATIEKDTRLYVRYGAALPQIEGDGLVFEIFFVGIGADGNEPEIIAAFPISGGAQSVHWRDADLDISYLTGRRGQFRIRCLPNPRQDANGGALAVADLCVAREDLLPLVRARSNKALRYRNELVNFGDVYDHSMYSRIQEKQAELAHGPARPVRKASLRSMADATGPPIILDDMEPFPNESAHTYGSRLLCNNIPHPRPDFIGRMKAMAQGERPLKVLSLCSGAARVEAEYASHVGSNVEWSLLDINPELLSMASRQFAPTLKLDLIEGNVNDIGYSGERWDIIMVVSALHHVVELEKLIRFCHESLNNGGEFWIIGECVGRNGNQLWPEAKEDADGIFQQLPERYRMNHNTGRVDQEIPVNDFSVGCFEGIRSQDIGSILERWFDPVDAFRSNCFLWRLLDMAYNDNYNVQSLEDRQWVQRLVVAEIGHFRDGGRGTELFGIYSPRPMRFDQ